MTLPCVTDGGTTRKDYKVQRLANQHFRKLCADTSRTDLDTEFSAFGEQFGAVKPEMFSHSTRRQRKLAYMALKGSVGRLRVIEGQELELRRGSLSEFGLSEFENDIFMQFEPGLNRMVFDSLQKTLGADVPFWGVLERGRLSGRNHLHLLVKPGTCEIGVSNGIIPDEKLLEKVAYLMKPPFFNVENFVGYISVKQAYPEKRVASRMTSRGLGNARTCKISVQEIEAATGLSLSKPQTTEHVQKRNETVQQISAFETESVGEKTRLPLTSSFETESVGENASAYLQIESGRVYRRHIPTLENLEPEYEVLIHNLKAVWTTGFFKNSKGLIGTTRVENMELSLKHYFAKNSLTTDEVWNLMEVCLSLPIDEPYVPFDMPTKSQVAA